MPYGKQRLLWRLASIVPTNSFYASQLREGGRSKAALQRILNERVKMKYATTLTFKFNLQEVPGFGGDEIDWDEVNKEIEVLEWEEEELSR